MRILFDYRPALRQRTGVGEFAHGLAEALQAALPAADRLTLFSSSWKDRLPRAAVTGAERVDARIPVRLLNYAWHRWEWPPCEWLAGPMDVVHAQHPLLMPARHAAQVVTIHDLFFLDHPEQTTAEIRRDYATLAAGHARRAGAVVVSSAWTREAVITRLGVEPGRVVLCPAGASPLARRPPPAPGGPILFLGTVEPRKNVGGLLKAYARLVDEWSDAPDLVIAGRTAEPAAALLARAGAAHLASRVRMPGYIDEQEKLRLYHQALMLVIPSFDEGFGLPALEAMTVGLPVVASRRGSLPEVLGEAAVYVDPDDPASMARGIRQLASDELLRARLADEGVGRAGTFRWQTGAARVIEAYREIAAKRGQR